MKKQIQVDCHAKVNLSLDVINRRKDGYHNLEMIMQEISLGDIITISVDTDDGRALVEVECSNSDVPQNSDNIAAQSAKLFLEKVGLKAEVKIHIEKHIPMGAGLGGGSSDAAGVLRALNEIFDNPLGVVELAEIGCAVGSDVPFFLYGGTMLAEDIGTKLSEVSAPKGVIVLIAKPMFSVSTPYVYKNLKLSKDTKHPDTKNVIKALECGNLKMLAESAGNVLETVTASEHDEINQYKKIMMKSGAVYALMSGSGPSVFGVFEGENEARKAEAELQKLTREVYLTRTM